MRFLDLRRSRGGWLDLRGRCKGFRMLWIFVGLKTLGLVASHSPGVIEDRRITMSGFSLTVE